MNTIETLDAKGTDLKIDVNGMTLCYDDFGSGAIPVIFLHGFPFDKSAWQPQIEFLKNTYRVIAIDFRGFGKSTAGKDVKSMSLYADDLVQFMDALQIDKAIVCGLSMGGYILLNAVNRFPQRFKALLLCDTQSIADSPEGKQKRSDTIAHIKVAGIADFANGFIEKVFCKESLAGKKELVERIRNIVLSTSPETMMEGLNAIAQRWDMSKTVEKISVPTLILCGSEDSVTLPSESEFLHRNIPNSRLHFIDRAGHLSNLEQPEEFNLYMADFLLAEMK